MRLKGWIGIAMLGVALLGVISPRAEATPIIFTSEAAYLAAITPNFEVNPGADSAGNPFPTATTQVNGTNVFSLGNNVDFSSPMGANPSLISVSSAHPDLGPTGPGGVNYSGSLRIDFGTAAVAVGFGIHQLQAFSLELYRGGLLQSTTVVSAASGFVGIQEALGFNALVINTNNTFWSLDGGHNVAGLPASGFRLVGQTVSSPVPVPDLGTSLFLFAIGAGAVLAYARL